MRSADPPGPRSLPFSEAEYRTRAARVRTEMSLRGVDVLYVMSPNNLAYLTGFESIWYPPRAPLGAVLAAGSDDLVFLDYERHENHARNAAFFDDAVFYRYEDAVEVVATEFARRGWCAGSVGMEWSTISPRAPLVRAVADALEGRGARVVAGDWIVDRVRAVKSPAELERVDAASAIVDAAVGSLGDYVRPGRTELQIAAHLNATMADLGGEEPAIRTMVSAGPDVWRKTHAAPSRRPVERGDVMYVDICGVVDRYHVDVCRTFAIGEDSPVARAILDYTAESVDKVVAGVRVGDPLDVAVRIAEEHVHARYGPDQIWWIGGYALGVALPPDWVGHTYLSNDAYEPFTWEPGYVTNYENILFDRAAGVTASYMETLVMTGGGIRILSSLPRTLGVLG